MKLVIVYNISDESTYNCTITQPLEFESAEALIEAFDRELKKTIIPETPGSFDYHQTFKVAGYIFNSHRFRWFELKKGKIIKVDYTFPEIYTYTLNCQEHHERIFS